MSHKEPNPALVDEAGIRKPVLPTMIGSRILESVMAPTDTIEANADEARHHLLAT